MTVAELRAYLTIQIAAMKFINPSATATKGLEAVVAGLGPFDPFEFADFAAFLAQAEEYHRTGILPVPKSPKGGKPTKAAAAPKPDPLEKVAAVKREVLAVYHSANQPEMTEARIESIRKPLATLTVSQLQELLGEMGYQATKSTKTKTVDQILRYVTQRFEARHKANSALG